MISLLSLRCRDSNSGHSESILVRMNVPACSHIVAMMLREPATMNASESKRRDVTSGQSVFTRGKKEFSCLARAGMVVRMREKREVRKEGEEEER